MKYCLRWIILFRLTKGRTGDPTGFRSGPYVLARLGQYTICPASSFQIDRFRTDIFFLYRIKLNENMDIWEARFLTRWICLFHRNLCLSFEKSMWKYWKYYCLFSFINASNSCFRTREEWEFSKRKIIDSFIDPLNWKERSKITLFQNLFLHLLYRHIDFSLRNYRQSLRKT